MSEEQQRTVVSSAYMMNLEGVEKIISLMNKLNNNGPRILPCGTPLQIFLHDEIEELI